MILVSRADTGADEIVPLGPISEPDTAQFSIDGAARQKSSNSSYATFCSLPSERSSTHSHQDGLLSIPYTPNKQFLKQSQQSSHLSLSSTTSSPCPRPARRVAMLTSKSTRLPRPISAAAETDKATSQFDSSWNHLG